MECTITWTKVILFPLQIKQALFSFHLKDKFFNTPPTYFSSQKGY